MGNYEFSLVTRLLQSLAFVLSLSATAIAEPFTLGECDGIRGIGIVGYSKSNGPDIETLNEISEICWTEETATLRSSHLTSRDLELTQNQGGISHYQRLNGGSTSPLNEQLQVGSWENRPGATSRYIRWTTEGSRTRDELNGYDYVTIEGFLLGPDEFAKQPSAATYDVEMQITGVGGSMLSMVFNMFLPMTGVVTLDGEELTIVVTGHIPGMMVGSATTDGTLKFGFAHPTGSMSLALENELLAGAPPQMWKSMDLKLEDVGAQFTGEEIAIVGSFVGEMEAFSGQKEPVTFSFLANGAPQ